MKIVKKMFAANFFTTGLAMFAMFFGSGNLIFPLAIGQNAGENTVWAVLGLTISAIIFPFFTLCLMLLYDGNYHRFFQNLGVVPGKIIAFTTLGLIGPFGVLPRCIAFSYSTFSIYFDAFTLVQYAALASFIVYVLSIKKNEVVGIIGNILTPILLVSLLIVIVRGLLADQLVREEAPKLSPFALAIHGFVAGYKTFDIFAALFFATAIIPSFRLVLGDNMHRDRKALLSLAVRSSLVGSLLLFLVYAGLSFVAANLSGGLVMVPEDKLLGVISTLTMGPTAGLVANLVVSLACLTTAISLAVVSAEFFRKEIFFHRLSYQNCLIITMLISFAFATLGFSGIMRFVIPVLLLICPAVITLIIANALHYFFGFKYIRTPVYLVFAISLVSLFIL